MQNNESKAPNIVLLVLKGIGALILGYVLVSVLLAIIYYASGADNSISKSDAIDRCEYYYHKRDFSALNQFLDLYDLDDEYYDVYWEAVKGYNTLISYYQWDAAAQQGMEGAENEAERLYDALSRKAQEPDFSQNAKIFKGFLKQAKTMEN